MLKNNLTYSEFKKSLKPGLPLYLSTRVLIEANYFPSAMRVLEGLGVLSNPRPETRLELLESVPSAIRGEMAGWSTVDHHSRAIFKCSTGEWDRMTVQTLYSSYVEFGFPTSFISVRPPISQQRSIGGKTMTTTVERIRRASISQPA